ncbi:signal peptidase I [Salidesulfovibrio onnuriiensis]|uniref:signal peptidase I n=1 Tax=Salidesulfovibrio onnuriiensis TaxID=2583823 RepID=UPI0011CCBAA1|nr:signal peptidase I [Salidesulfovibrio onnuriiensis]
MTAGTRDRKPWAAGLLSLLMPGLGQLYNGQGGKGFGLLFLSFALLLVAVPLFKSFAGLVTAMSLLLVFLGVVVWDAARQARRQGVSRLKWYNRWWVYVLLVAVNALAGLGADSYLSATVYESFYVPSESMEPTLMPGDRFLGRVLRGDERPQTGDIVVFHPPGMDGVYYVKRLVAGPGDVVEVREGVVSINGRRVRSGKAVFDHVKGEPVRDRAPGRLGRDEYWVMGDNRGKSYDSRFFGPVSRERIGYKALYVFWASSAKSGSRWDRFGQRLDGVNR